MKTKDVLILIILVCCNYALGMFIVAVVSPSKFLLMGIIFAWLLFSLLVGFMGSGRNIGFGGAFVLSLLLSPLIGFIFTAISKSKDDIAKEKQLTEAQKAQTEYLHKIAQDKSNHPKLSIADELEKLKRLRDDQVITEDEFQNQKSKLLS